MFKIILICIPFSIAFHSPESMALGRRVPPNKSRKSVEFLYDAVPLLYKGKGDGLGIDMGLSFFNRFSFGPSVKDIFLTATDYIPESKKNYDIDLKLRGVGGKLKYFLKKNAIDDSVVLGVYGYYIFANANAYEIRDSQQTTRQKYSGKFKAKMFGVTLGYQYVFDFGLTFVADFGVARFIGIPGQLHLDSTDYTYNTSALPTWQPFGAGCVGFAF